MKTIAGHLKDIMTEQNVTYAWQGNHALLTEAYARSGRTTAVHPLDRIKAVMNSVARSDLFEHSGYIRAVDASGSREIQHRCFKFKEQS